MLNFFLPKSTESRFSYLETFMFLSLFVIIGYFLDSKDILFINRELMLLTILLGIITLFYGIGNGLFALVLIAIAMFGFYEKFNQTVFLKELVFVLILGIFHSYWTRSLNLYRNQKIALESKLDKVGTAFYALKVSHDQLELNHIIAPASLRNTLVYIVENIENRQDQYNSMLALLTKTFNITKISICKVQDGKCVLRATSADSSKLVNDDHLIQKAIETASPAYIPQNLQIKTPYVAVIPAVVSEETKALLLIEEIPFMAFNEDNMIAVSFILNFFFMSIDSHKMVSRSHIMPEFKNDFRFEYLRLFNLYKKFQIDSAIIAFRTQSELASHRLNEVITFTGRGLDVTGNIVHNGMHITLILTLFTIESSADLLKHRIINSLDEDTLSNIDVSIFTISTYTILRKFMGFSHVK